MLIGRPSVRPQNVPYREGQTGKCNGTNSSNATKNENVKSQRQKEKMKIRKSCKTGKVTERTSNNQF